MTQGELYMPKVSLANCPEAELQIDVWQYYPAQAYISTCLPPPTLLTGFVSILAEELALIRILSQNRR